MMTAALIPVNSEIQGYLAFLNAKIISLLRNNYFVKTKYYSVKTKYYFVTNEILFRKNEILFRKNEILFR